jgi:hypothetical protein
MSSPPVVSSRPYKWSVGDFVAAVCLSAFALATNLNTVLNNAYSFGSSYDSAIFQTMIWRSGWMLRSAAIIDPDMSYLNIHLSPISYLPNALSYFMPIDRMSYCGLVYGIIYTFLLVLVFHAFLRLYGHNTLIAALASFAFYISGPVNSGQWEPHQEIASALFTAGFFVAWGLGRGWIAIAMIGLNAGVREDCGMLLALPLFLLWAHERWIRRDTGACSSRHTFGYALFSALLSVVAFAVKRLYFNRLDTIATFYYGANPFAHLSSGVISDRLQFTILHGQYLWLPGLVLLVGAVWLRDLRLVIGWAASFPYWLFNFFSILDVSAELGGYKAFPVILTMIWPAIIALRSPQGTRSALGIVQAAVLLSATVSWENGGLRLAGPSGIDGLRWRWELRPETERAALYRAFEARLDNNSLGVARASMAALALYPYSFPRWDKSQLLSGLEDEAPRLDSILWFNGDRDQSTTQKWLERAQFQFFYRIIGTRLRLAARGPLHEVPAFAGALEPIDRRNAERPSVRSDD